MKKLLVLAQVRFKSDRLLLVLWDCIRGLVVCVGQVSTVDFVSVSLCKTAWTTVGLSILFFLQYSWYNVFLVYLVCTKLKWMLWMWYGKLSLCVTIHHIQSLFNILAHLGSCLSSDMRMLLYPQPLLSFGLDVSHRTHMSSDEKTLSQQHWLACCCAFPISWVFPS